MPAVYLSQVLAKHTQPCCCAPKNATRTVQIQAGDKSLAGASGKRLARLQSQAPRQLGMCPTGMPACAYVGTRAWGLLTILVLNPTPLVRYRLRLARRQRLNVRLLPGSDPKQQERRQSSVQRVWSSISSGTSNLTQQEHQHFLYLLLLQLNTGKYSRFLVCKHYKQVCCITMKALLSRRKAHLREIGSKDVVAQRAGIACSLRAGDTAHTDAGVLLVVSPRLCNTKDVSALQYSDRTQQNILL